MNRQNRLEYEKVWEMHNVKHQEMYEDMRKVCGVMFKHLTRIGLTKKGLRDGDKETWYRKYQRIARSFFNEDYQQVNREASDTIDQMNNKGINNIDLEMDFYLIGIDASIKDGNSDIDLMKQLSRIASNDPAITLRELMFLIYNFEVSRLNDIGVGEVIEKSEEKGMEAEDKMDEKLKSNNNSAMFHENEIIWRNVLRDIFLFAKERV
jgi:hypothetical protein